MSAELEARLHALRAAREGCDRDTYIFRWGVMLGTLSRLGYRIQAAPVPIDPADRWRRAPGLNLPGVGLGRAAFDDAALLALDADGHTLLHYLRPPD